MENWTQENSGRNQKSTGEPSFLFRPMFAPRILSRILLFYPRSWPWLNAKISIILSFNFVSKRETCSLLFNNKLERTNDWDWIEPSLILLSSLLLSLILFIIIITRLDVLLFIESSKVVRIIIFARDNNKRSKERSFLLTLIQIFENNNDLR